jgi:hypothetical protein
MATSKLSEKTAANSMVLRGQLVKPQNGETRGGSCLAGT